MRLLPLRPPSASPGATTTWQVSKFDYQVVHVNAEFASQVSDHDPQVVDITPRRRPNP